MIVRLTPRGGRDAIDGVGALADGRPVLLARVRVAPEAGAANGALIRLIAAAAGAPASAARVTTGATGRLKEIHVSGDPVALAEALSRAAGLIGSQEGQGA